MHTKVLFFSGTGNSFATAKQIASQTDGTIVPLTAELLKKGEPLTCDKLVVVFPSYAYGMPKMLYRFFRETDFKCRYIALVVTYGSHFGASLSHGVKILRQRKIETNYAKGVKCVENYIPIFGLRSDEKICQAIEKQREETAKIATEIADCTQNKISLFKPFSRFVSVLFRMVTPLFAKCYRITKRCTRCGICRKICPANAITSDENDRPKVIASRCEHCQACLNWCPLKAINYVRMHKNSRRFHHSDITLEDMLKRD